jgi:hypothetical protein
MLYDSGEAYAEGDPDLDSIDWAEVERLQAKVDDVNALSGPDRDLYSLYLLAEMYGDDLEVL